jgi:hypothetical protein
VAKNKNKEKKYPLVIGVVALAVSPLLLLLPMFKLVSNSDPLISIIGWFLTPVVTFTAYGFSVYLKNKELANRNFERSRVNYELLLRIFAYISLVIAILHIWRLASIWSVV